VKLLEKLPLPLYTQYRVSMDEEDLGILATVFLAYLEKTERLEESVAIRALELVELLKEIKSEDYRHYWKLAEKIKKKSSQAPR
jgi:hypothetical protein